MLKPDGEKRTKGEYLNFEDKGPVTPGSKTRKFSVHSRHNGSLLGYIRYFVPWRQYVLAPLNAMFDAKCLTEAAEFCRQVTAQQRKEADDRRAETRRKAGIKRKPVS